MLQAIREHRDHDMEKIIRDLEKKPNCYEAYLKKIETLPEYVGRLLHITDLVIHAAEDLSIYHAKTVQPANAIKHTVPNFLAVAREIFLLEQKPARCF